MKKLKNRMPLKKILLNYMKNNSKEYILVILIFIIGLFIGVMYINNCSEEKSTSISMYILEFIDKFKKIENINTIIQLTTSIKENIFLAIVIWGLGTTIIGMPIVLAIILFRGFCLGYTVSAIVYTLGFKKGIIFCLISLFLHNIFFIPALLTIGVSSIKLYKNIIEDKRRDNIKIAILRHTSISIIMLFLMIMSKLIENEISIRILKKGISIF